MTLLDSDVLLSLISASEPEEIQDWAKQMTSKPHTTALAVAEVFAAIESTRQRPSEFYRGRAFQTVLDSVLHRRVLPFDVECAAGLVSLSRTSHPTGNYYPLAVLIHAAIAKRYRMSVVTARPAEFAGLDVEITALDLSNLSSS